MFNLPWNTSANISECRNYNNHLNPIHVDVNLCIKFSQLKIIKMLMTIYAKNRIHLCNKKKPVMNFDQGIMKIYALYRAQ